MRPAWSRSRASSTASLPTIVEVNEDDWETFYMQEKGLLTVDHQASVAHARRRRQYIPLLIIATIFSIALIYAAFFCDDNDANVPTPIVQVTQHSVQHTDVVQVYGVTLAKHGTARSTTTVDELGNAEDDHIEQSSLSSQVSLSQLPQLDHSEIESLDDLLEHVAHGTAI